ncbi:DUF6402 family protein [Caballeronia sp. LZ016]|uniref:DUF6402 family protein n=1 Tax=Caballeronia sp. LZ016 TaxID=3038554 RepID=UPI00285A3103|nr:DUF6402 family protein [Caballeronia sp. LZ016]MDR5740306.1 DUF6402 family protein [Caballeronia sp. LZ016]
MRISDFTIPYYSSDFLRRWKRRDGCNAILGLNVSLQRQPPDCQFHVAPPPPPPPLAKPDPAIAFIDTLQKVYDFFHEPPKARPPAPPKPAIQIPPFDLQEIPGAMRMVNMPMSAKLMERWFAGALNYSPTEDDEKALVNQDGNPYPPSMYEMSMVKLDWVLSFPRAKEAHDQLLSRSVLASPRALDGLQSILAPFSAADRCFNTLALCNGSLIETHKRFQYQYRSVESSFNQKIRQFANREYAFRGVPDDLTGALGSFNIYAAPSDVRFNWNGTEASISSVVVYVRDNYTFTDKAGDDSQYLGHWNRDRIIVVPYNIAMSTLSWHLPGVGELQPPDEVNFNSLWAKAAVAVADPRKRGNVYYPVYNSSYRDWQRTHKRGGDFVIFTDYETIRLNPPLAVKF